MWLDSLQRSLGIRWKRSSCEWPMLLLHSHPLQFQRNLKKVLHLGLLDQKMEMDLLEDSPEWVTVTIELWYTHLPIFPVWRIMYFWNHCRHWESALSLKTNLQRSVTVLILRFHNRVGIFYFISFTLYFFRMSHILWVCWHCRLELWFPSWLKKRIPRFNRIKDLDRNL